MSTDRYYVYNTNFLWSDADNWSTEDGGVGGSGIPTAANDVYLTTTFASGCTITEDSECNSLTTTSTVNDITIEGVVTFSVNDLNMIKSSYIISNSGIINFNGDLLSNSHFFAGAGTINWNGSGEMDLGADTNTTVYHKMVVNGYCSITGAGRRTLAFRMYDNGITVGASGHMTSSGRASIWVTGPLDVYGLWDGNSIRIFAPSEGSGIFTVHPSGRVSVGSVSYDNNLRSEELILSPGVWNTDFFTRCYTEGETIVFPSSFAADSLRMDVNNSAWTTTSHFDFATYKTRLEIMGGDLSMVPAGTSPVAVDFTDASVLMTGSGTSNITVYPNVTGHIGDVTLANPSGITRLSGNIHFNSLTANNQSIDFNGGSFGIHNDLVLNGCVLHSDILGPSMSGATIAVSGDMFLFGSRENTLYIKDLHFNSSSSNPGIARYCYANNSIYTGSEYIDATHISNVGYNIPVSGWRFCDRYYPISVGNGTLFLQQIHNYD